MDHTLWANLGLNAKSILVLRSLLNRRQAALGFVMIYLGMGFERKLIHYLHSCWITANLKFTLYPHSLPSLIWKTWEWYYSNSFSEGERVHLSLLTRDRVWHGTNANLKGAPYRVQFYCLHQLSHIYSGKPSFCICVSLLHLYLSKRGHKGQRRESRFWMLARKTWLHPTLCPR